MAEHRVQHVMGMPVSVDVRDNGIALDPVFAWLREVDARFSTYRADSDIRRIDRGELAPSPLVREVLDRSAALRAETGGFFDVRAGGRLDPSGLVKGWAVQRAAELLERAGARCFCVNAGGDVIVRGRPWRVGIRHPLQRRALAAVLTLEHGAVATSGAYERGEHILDPHTGRPPHGVLSVTVTGPDLGCADAYATAAFAMGERGPAWTARLEGYEAMTVLVGERVLLTPGFPHAARQVARRERVLEHSELPRRRARMLFGQEHVERYVATDGEEGHDWQPGVPALILTTTGRKSGEERPTPLIYGMHGENAMVVASKAGADQPPTWYLNLRDKPEVHVQIRGDKFTASARDATPEEKPELWKQMAEIWPQYNDYQEKTDREIPVVVLERQS